MTNPDDTTPDTSTVTTPEQNPPKAKKRSTRPRKTATANKPDSASTLTKATRHKKAATKVTTSEIAAGTEAPASKRRSRSRKPPTSEMPPTSPGECTSGEPPLVTPPEQAPTKVEQSKTLQGEQSNGQLPLKFHDQPSFAAVTPEELDTQASTSPIPSESQDGIEPTQPLPPQQQKPPIEPAPPVPGEGIVELSGKGFGFLRDPKRNYQQTPRDIFIRPEIVRRFALRDGYYVRGLVRKGHRGPQLDRLETINGESPEHYQRLPHFEELTSTNPSEWIKLETAPDRFTTRVIDLMAPIGKGQRGLIVAPPRTGKTTLLQHIAEAVSQNYPQMPLFILLVDERPEEVTEITRACPTAEVMASSNDNDLKHHTRIAQLAIERAKRLVERGKDVFMLMDSITRIGRAFNNATSNSGRTLSGGIDAKAMEIPRRLFAAARNTEEAGSLTIIATALIETGSRMDEYIFQEFKGTGNMELVLDRRISDMRVYPAIDIFLSGTRREELLIPADLLEKISIIRRGLSGHKPIEAIERLLSFLKKFPLNEQMLREIPSA